MKRHFGSILRRSFLGNGDTLNETEFALLETLIASLPEHLRTIVERQFDTYNVVQREIDGRALNFWKTRFLLGNTTKGMPLLEMDQPELPLIRVIAIIGSSSKKVHATLVAVNGRAFCMSLSRAVTRECGPVELEVIDTKQSWRSNFPVGRASLEPGP